MGNPKFDGVVEAVRYGPDGQVLVVRMYERRGPTFSDWLMVNREELVKRLKAGKVIVAGSRKHFLASTFDVVQPVRLVGERGRERLATPHSVSVDHDDLKGVLLF